MLALVGVYGEEVAVLAVNCSVLRRLHVEPPSVEYLNVIEPVGIMPGIPVTVAEAVTDCPKVIGVGGLSVGVVIVAAPDITVQLPVPTAGTFPAMFVTPEQIVWSGPALDSEGFGKL